MPEGNGITSLNFSGTVSANGDTLTGTSTWTWTDGNTSCSGTAQIFASKIPESLADVSGTWEGNWQSLAHSLNGTFTVDIIQDSLVLSGSINVPDIGLNDAELKGTITENSFTFGDIDEQITFTGTVVGDSTSSGAYIYPALNDNGTWQATKVDSVTIPVVAWQKSDIGFAFKEQDQLIIGEARNDGVMRVYSGDGMESNAGNIYEFSFSTSHWDKAIFGENNYGLIHICGIDIGTGRNDEISRVYASGYSVFEHYYVIDSWSWEKIAPEIQWTNDLVVGDARNDGQMRIYIALWNGIAELTYNNGNWDQLQINTDGQSIGKLLITDGRNDGTLRLYTAADWDGHVYEHTWSGSSWQYNDCGPSGAVSLQDMDAGDGRNDGVNRIYLAANGGIYELSYDGQIWKYMEIGSVSYATAIAIGCGRNDGSNRVYVAENQDALREYTYSGTWLKASDIDSSFRVNDIVIGNGRNDSLNRVYVTSSDNHIYEYTIDQ